MAEHLSNFTDNRLDPDQLDAIKDEHVGHVDILGSDIVEGEINHAAKMMELGEIRLNPEELGQPHWKYMVSHTPQELADIEYDEELNRFQGRTKYFVNHMLRKNLQQKFDDPENRQLFNAYMQSAPNFLKAQVDDGEHDWSDWMLNIANDDQVMNVLKWHNHRMAERQQSPETHQRIAQQKESYKKALANAIEDYSLPEAAGHAIEEVDSVNVRIGDVFDTLMQDRLGYHQRGTDHVVVEEGDFDHTFRHELNHAVLGQLPYSWMDEPFAEHLGFNPRKGEFINLDMENIDQGSYVEESIFLKTLISIASEKGVPYADFDDNLTLIVDAYVSNDNSKDNADLKAFESRLGKRLGFEDDTNALQIIDNRIDKYYQQILAAGAPDRDAMTSAILAVREELLQEREVYKAQKETALVRAA